MKKSILFLSGFILFGMVLSVSHAQTQRGTGTTNLTINETTLFAGSCICARCHEGLFENGNDVSPVTLWHSIMMANSAANINIPEIKLFRDLYKSADKAPVILEFWY